MKSILKVLLTAVAVVILAKILSGVVVDGFVSAIIVAIVISLLRFIVKPILVILTIPITILTFGLFLFVINALIIMMADYFVDGFAIRSFWIALLFSILLSIFQSILFGFIKEDKKS
ncbi:MAG: putative membrane protein [Flavobacteriales bacterium]|jgi:putative membrane protein